MGDFGMELDAIDGLRVVSDGGKRSSLSVTDDMEILREILELISMGHPDLVSRTHEEVMSCYEREMPTCISLPRFSKSASTEPWPNRVI